jgi:hypothetical protein
MDQPAIPVVIHIRGGLVAGVGMLARDLARVRVIVVDQDEYEAGECRPAYTQHPTTLESWATDRAWDPLVLARGELSEALSPGDFQALNIPALVIDPDD